VMWYTNGQIAFGLRQAEAYQLSVAPHDCTGRVAQIASIRLSPNAPKAAIQGMVRASCRGGRRGEVNGLPFIGQGYACQSGRPGLGAAPAPDISPDISTGRRDTPKGAIFQRLSLGDRCGGTGRGSASRGVLKNSKRRPDCVGSPLGTPTSRKHARRPGFWCAMATGGRAEPMQRGAAVSSLVR